MGLLLSFSPQGTLARSHLSSKTTLTYLGANSKISHWQQALRLEFEYFGLSVLLARLLAPESFVKIKGLYFL